MGCFISTCVKDIKGDIISDIYYCLSKYDTVEEANIHFGIMYSKEKMLDEYKIHIGKRYYALTRNGEMKYIELKYNDRFYIKEVQQDS